jgi:hypothetical protein
MIEVIQKLARLELAVVSNTYACRFLVKLQNLKYVKVTNMNKTSSNSWTCWKYTKKCTEHSRGVNFWTPVIIRWSVKIMWNQNNCFVACPTINPITKNVFFYNCWINLENLVFFFGSEGTSSILQEMFLNILRQTNHILLTR